MTKIHPKGTEDVSHLEQKSKPARQPSSCKTGDEVFRREAAVKFCRLSNEPPNPTPPQSQPSHRHRGSYLKTEAVSPVASFCCFQVDLFTTHCLQ